MVKLRLLSSDDLSKYTLIPSPSNFMQQHKVGKTYHIHQPLLATTHLISSFAYHYYYEKHNNLGTVNFLLCPGFIVYGHKVSQSICQCIYKVSLYRLIWFRKLVVWRFGTGCDTWPFGLLVSRLCWWRWNGSRSIIVVIFLVTKLGPKDIKSIILTTVVIIITSILLPVL